MHGLNIVNSDELQKYFVLQQTILHVLPPYIMPPKHLLCFSGISWAKKHKAITTGVKMMCSNIMREVNEQPLLKMP